MAIQMLQADALAHIDGPDTLAAKAASRNACITVLDVIQVCFQINGDQITITAELKTPLGNVNLGSATISPQNTTIKLGGSVDGFRAEVTATFNYSTMDLAITGTACAPIVGCRSGTVHVHI